MKTPLTDAASFSARDMNRIRVNVVPADFARRLESDRARLIAELKAMIEAFDGNDYEQGQVALARALLRELGEST